MARNQDDGANPRWIQSYVSATCMMGGVNELTLGEWPLIRRWGLTTIGWLEIMKRRPETSAEDGGELGEEE
jgi:hypothetical protein